MRLNVLEYIYIYIKSLLLPEGMETGQTFAVGEKNPEK